jgi:hypothetical protein
VVNCGAVVHCGGKETGAFKMGADGGKWGQMGAVIKIGLWHTTQSMAFTQGI